MNHAQIEVTELLDGFKEFGMTDTQAMFATLRVLQARYSEALVNAPMGSRVSQWEKAIDYLQNLLNADQQ